MAALGNIRHIDDEVRERGRERYLHAVDPHIERPRSSAHMGVERPRQSVRDAMMLGVKVDT